MLTKRGRPIHSPLLLGTETKALPGQGDTGLHKGRAPCEVPMGNTDVVGLSCCACHKVLKDATSWLRSSRSRRGKTYFNWKVHHFITCGLPLLLTPHHCLSSVPSWPCDSPGCRDQCPGRQVLMVMTQPLHQLAARRQVLPSGPGGVSGNEAA